MTYIDQVKFNPAQIAFDAGGIMRVAQQTTLLDGKILNADDALIWQNAGDGTGSWAANKYNMSVTSGQWFKRATKRFYPYFAGKSQRVEWTFDKFAAQANVKKRFGYFSSNAVSPFGSNYDGFYIENDGSTIKLYVSRAGTPTLNGLTHTSWSGYANLAEYQTIATWDNFTVVEAKYLWLGGAVVVISVKTSAGFVEAHRFDYSGTAQDIMTLSPNQQVRYEIDSTTGAGDFRYICSQVATEGSIDESGYGLSEFNTSAIAANAVGTIYALIGLKKSDTYRDTAVQITDIGLSNAAITSDQGILMLVVNPTLSGALTYGAKSRIQTALATNQTLTGGRVIAAIPTASSAGGTASLNKNFLAWLSSTLANAHDEYVLAYMPTTATQSVFGIVNLKEY